MEGQMEVRRVCGQRYCVYTPEETESRFIPLRDRIFRADTAYGCIEEGSPPIIRNPEWPRVIIRGSLFGSDLSQPPSYPSRVDPEVRKEWLEDWRNDDPRDPLQPLFDILVEDGIDEIIHMSSMDGEKVVGRHDGVYVYPIDAVGTGVSRDEVETVLRDTHAMEDTERLLFDRTGRWGFYASWEEIGILGGEPEFMARYVEKAGGMDLIRKKADEHWQYVLDRDDFLAPFVPQIYKLAGWENPPTKRQS